VSPGSAGMGPCDVMMRDEREPEWMARNRVIAAVLAEDAAADRDVRAEVVAWRRKTGLPVDDAVIDGLVTRGPGALAHPGMWETPDEAHRRKRAQAVIAESADTVEAYVDAHADVHAGSWIEWNDNEPTFVVAFVDDLERHARVLDFPRVRLTQRARTLRELQPIAEEIVLGQLEGKVPPGTEWPGAGVDVVDNVVEVCGVGPDERAAAAWLAHRYGDRVRLTWCGSAEPRVVPVSWQVWEASAHDPHLVTVRWTMNSAYEVARVEVQEDADSVEIAVFERIPSGMTTMAGAYRSAEVQLGEPLGERRVLDSVTGRARPRL
jgi:hypothetical protein